MALRWGIASTGFIANDFVNSLKGLPKDEHQVVAVAARSLSSAENFAKTHNIPKFYEGYINLAKDENVQVVYIAVLNPQHYELTLYMLEHGKHILCEKPFAMNKKQAKKMIDLAKSKNLFIMEAMWSRFFPVYREVKSLLEAGKIGDIRYASVTFGRPMNHLGRVSLKEMGGSSILDQGVYILQFQQLAFDGIDPEKLTTTGHLNENGVDDVTSVVFSYPDGKTAVVTCNATVELPNEGIIVGTKGTIKIPSFWCPVSYELNGKIKEIPLIANNEKFNYPNSAGLAYQAIEVRKQILDKKIESDILSHELTLKLAGWMDAVRKEIGVVFPADSE